MQAAGRALDGPGLEFGHVRHSGTQSATLRALLHRTVEIWLAALRRRIFSMRKAQGVLRRAGRAHGRQGQS
jgi:hypothetical protein